MLSVYTAYICTFMPYLHFLKQRSKAQIYMKLTDLMLNITMLLRVYTAYIYFFPSEAHRPAWAFILHCQKFTSSHWHPLGQRLQDLYLIILIIGSLTNESILFVKIDPKQMK